MSRWQWLWGLLIVVATLLAYARLSTAEFLIYDDSKTIQHNPRLNPPTFANISKFWPPLLSEKNAANDNLTGRAFRPDERIRINHMYGLYIPLTYTVWGALAAIAQTRSAAGTIELNPWIFHCANIALHAISGVLVFALLRRLIAKDWAAAAGALLFVLHPVQVESVGWISGMKDVLCGTLCSLALWQYVEFALLHPLPRGEGRGEGLSRPDGVKNSSPHPNPLPKGEGAMHYSVALIAFLLALLSKPSAVTVPLLAMMLDVLVMRRRFGKVLLALLPWFALAIVFAVIAAMAQPAIGVPRAPLWGRPLIAADSLAFYLYKLIWPMRLGIDYGRRPDVVIRHGWIHFTWLAPAAVAIALWLLPRRDKRPLIAAAAIFALAALPTLGLTTFLFQYFSTPADHYLYVAMLGPALALAWMADRFSSRATQMVVATALILLALRTFLQTRVWHDDYALFSHAIAVNHDSYLAHNNLGSVEYSNRNFPAAEAEFLAANRAGPNYPEPLDNLHRVALQQNRIEDAIRWYERYLHVKSQLPPELRGQFWNDHIYLAKLLAQQGRYNDAIDHFQAALRLNPGNVEAKRGLTNAWRLKNEPATQDTAR